MTCAESESPRDALLEFLQSTYEAGARLGKWDRGAGSAIHGDKEEQDETVCSHLDQIRVSTTDQARL